MSEPTTETPTAPVVELPPAPPAPVPDEKPQRARRSRSTTRAGRAAEAAARKAAGKPDKAPRTGSRAKVDVATPVRGLHELAGGLALPMAGLPSTGAAMVAAAPEAGEVWAALAKRYPAIESLFVGTGDALLFVKLAMVYAPVVMAGVDEARTPRAERAAKAAAKNPGAAPAFDPMAMALAMMGGGQGPESMFPLVGQPGAEQPAA